MRSLLVVEPKEPLQRPLELVGAREVHRWNATRCGQLQVALDGFLRSKSEPRSRQGLLHERAHTGQGFLGATAHGGTKEA